MKFNKNYNRRSEAKVVIKFLELELFSRKSGNKISSLIYQLHILFIFSKIEYIYLLICIAMQTISNIFKFTHYEIKYVNLILMLWTEVLGNFVGTRDLKSTLVVLEPLPWSYCLGIYQLKPPSPKYHAGETTLDFAVESGHV